MRMAKRNLVSIFPASAYDRQLFAEKLWLRSVFVASGPDIAQDVLVTHCQDYPKSRQLQRALAPLIGGGSFISNGAPWQRQRAIAAALFKPPMLRRFSAVVREATLEMCERWSGMAAPRVVDLGEEMTRLTADIIARCLFSERLAEEDTKRIFEAFAIYQGTLSHFSFADVVGLPDWVPRVPSRRARRAAKDIHAILERLIEARKASQTRPDDLLSALIAAEDEETGARFSTREIRDEMAVFLLAGHESTASVLTWTWLLLSSHAETLAEVRDEISAVLTERDPVYDDIARLEAINRTIQESLRLYPPISFYSRDTVCPHAFVGRTIPAGSLMVVSSWLLHRHREYWDEPDVFRPGRFAPEGARNRPRFAYIPFGAGPRTCLGASFAMMEMTLIIAIMARRFTLTCLNSDEIEPVCRFTLRALPSVRMQVEAN